MQAPGFITNHELDRFLGGGPSGQRQRLRLLKDSLIPRPAGIDRVKRFNIAVFPRFVLAGLVRELGTIPRAAEEMGRAASELFASSAFTELRAAVRETAITLDAWDFDHLVQGVADHVPAAVQEWTGAVTAAEGELGERFNILLASEMGVIEKPVGDAYIVSLGEGGVEQVPAVRVATAVEEGRAVALERVRVRGQELDYDRYALAHASFLPDAETHRAILLSDSCLTATALAQGRQDRSVSAMLLFAPVRQAQADRWQTLVDDVDFERFALPDDERLPRGSVAELRHSFMVEARVIKEHVDARVAKPAPALAEELEARWNAYAARRGPRAYERNTLKLAVLLADGTQPGEEDESVGDAVAAVLDLAWSLEGADLEGVSEAEAAIRLTGVDAPELTQPLLGRLEERLRELADLAGEAADAVNARR